MKTPIEEAAELVLGLSGNATPRPWRLTEAYLAVPARRKRVMLEEWKAGVASEEGGYAVVSCGLASDPRSKTDATYILEACTYAPDLARAVLGHAQAVREAYRAGAAVAAAEAVARERVIDDLTRERDDLRRRLESAS